MYRDRRHGPATCRVDAAGLGVAAAAGLPTLPPVFRWLVRMLRVGKASPQAVDKLAHLNYGLLAFGWLGMAGGWVLIGLSLWAILVGSGYATPHVVLGRSGRLHRGCRVGGRGRVPVAVTRGRWSPRSRAVSAARTAIRLGRCAVAAIVARLVWLVSEVVISGILYLKGNPRNSNDEIRNSREFQNSKLGHW